jgi:hypothetical protein
MADRQLAKVLSQVCEPAASEAGLSDAELLARFVAGRDEAAFEMLVRVEPRRAKEPQPPGPTRE